MSGPTGGCGGALVTGGARRIGRAIALDLAEAGFAVAITYNRSADEAVEVVRAIEDAGGTAAALRVDLAREAEVVQAVPAAVESIGPLTLLVNNASHFVNDGARTATRESWDAHIEANLRAPLVLTQAFAAQLPDGAAGNVINMLDQRVWKPTPYFLSYTVAKIGLWTLTRTLAMALAPRIRVNAIGPGPTMKSDRQTDEQFERQWRAIPLERPTDPQEICAAIRFLVGMPAMTGQMLALDGGEHLGWAQPSRGIVPFE
jgi:NAD(P)-dependent dehydrogenase (short-subunit alcohol dehydrogenase family)